MVYRRKVQVTGGGTFLVTLPKEWADAMGIAQGSTVLLVPNDSGALLLVPAGTREKNRCAIPMNGREPVHLQRDIIARYIAGYDVIEVIGDRIRPEERRMVREIAQSLVGLEVLGETQGAVVLHSVVNVRDFPVDQTIRRIFAITLAMWDDAVAACTARDEELARDVAERDGDVDRLVLLVARQFGLLLRDLLVEEELKLSRFQFHHYQAVADQLERVADHAVKVSRAALSLAAELLPAVGDRVRQAAAASREILTGAVRAFEGRDVPLANRVLAEKERKDTLAGWAQAAIREQPENAHPISIVMDSLLRSREYGFNIAEIAVDAAVPLGHAIGEQETPRSRA
ncbi:MAG: AbrB/MazE/SpoVT family DNA-binding domain-containing protein [Candidatus Acetothermia bacterium]|jgi:phosphate transport system protein|nr:AbrB/MazE/SpoVT family DNA-binding domain-containing protein [Candidatus Acetothermia bacterium]